MSTENLDGRFTLKGPLRCAGVGSLVCAEDKDGARIAIRMIPQRAQGEEAVAAAERMPVHPVLPRTLGSGAQNGSSWVAIDFPEGELLTNRLPLTTPALLTMGSMVSSALATLHENEIIHGELSSDSVLAVSATSQDRFVLFDAPLVVINRLTDRRGEERLLAQLTALVPFLSPERARGGEASQAADIWALGMIISLASGAKAVPGGSTLEKIAMIVSNKWRPAVSGLLPIALRLLLTRMLAPDAGDRPSSREVASELEHLCVALNPIKLVIPHLPAQVDTLPMPQVSIEPLIAKTRIADPFEGTVTVEKSVNPFDGIVTVEKRVDPFETLVAQGVTATIPHGEPTRRMGIPLTTETQQGVDVTDPYALAVPTAPSPVPSWNQPTAPPAVVPIPLIIPAHPSQQRRASMPLPPILDPEAIAVPPQPARLHAPLPVMAATPEVAQQRLAQTQTMIFGVLPGAERPPKEPAVLTEDVAEEAAAAVAERAASPQSTAPDSLRPPSHSFLTAPSVHDQAEDAFAAEVRRTQNRRFIALGIAAGVLVLAAGGLIATSMSGEQPEDPAVQRQPEAEEVERVQLAAPVKPEPARPEPVQAGTAKAEPEQVAPEPLKAEFRPDGTAKEPAPVKAETVKAEPVKAEPAPVKAEPAPVKAEPAPVKAETATAAPAKAEPAPVKAETAKVAPAKAEPAKAAPVVAKAAAPARPAKQVRTKPVVEEEAPRRPASRLDEGD